MVQFGYKILVQFGYKILVQFGYKILVHFRSKIWYNLGMKICYNLVQFGCNILVQFGYKILVHFRYKIWYNLGMKICYNLGATFWYNLGATFWYNLGTKFSDTLPSAVQNASVVIICLSEAYCNSTNCKRELEYAANLKKDMIILKMEKDFTITNKGSISLLLASELYVAFQYNNNPREILT